MSYLSNEQDNFSPIVYTSDGVILKTGDLVILSNYNKYKGYDWYGYKTIFEVEVRGKKLFVKRMWGPWGIPPYTTLKTDWLEVEQRKWDKLPQALGRDKGTIKLYLAMLDIDVSKGWD